MTIEVIRDPGSAAPIGPYSQGIKAGGFVFVAGEKGIDPATGEIVEGGIEAETRQTLENVKGILVMSNAGYGRHRPQLRRLMRISSAALGPAASSEAGCPSRA